MTTVNNVLTASLKLTTDLTALCVSSDGTIIVMGDASGEVHVLDSWDLSCMLRFDSIGSAITCVAMDAQGEGVALVGLYDGRIRAITLDRESLRQRSSVLSHSQTHEITPTV